jgi:asparagine synthase (glutamine-hydrolysing)
VTALGGVWRLDGRDDAPQACARVLGAQASYGPHGTAQYDDGPLAMGRSLYRLLPEDIHDRGPLTSASGRFVLTADLRLDNREEIADSLGRAAAECAALCDAALLLSAFERFGEACLDRIVGDFAFAVWDRAERRLLLARDPLGQRPLHYHRGDRLFAFASMAKGLHALAEIPRAPDAVRTAEFAALIPAGGAETFFEGIRRVLPGECLTATAAGLSARRYWQPHRNRSPLPPGEYVEGLRHHLGMATRARLRRAEGSVGSHLSAGLDSSSVAATAASLLAGEGVQLFAFTAVPRAGYDGSAQPWQIADESGHAAHTAALYPNIEHVCVRSQAASPFADMDRSFLLHEQPMLNLCNMGWIDAINDTARAKGVRVMLTGALGNFGISYSGLEWLARLLATGRWPEWAATAMALRRGGWMGGKNLVLTSIGPFLPQALWRRAVGAAGHYDIAGYSGLREDLVQSLDLAGRARARGHDLTFKPWADGFAMRLFGLRWGDLGTWNKGTLAGWGIDQRDPTSDRRLVEFCLAVPPREFLRGGMPRSLIRRAMAGRLPESVVMERRKGHQAADWHETLAPLRHAVAAEIDSLADNEATKRMFDIPRLRRLVDAWPSSDWESGANALAYRLVLHRAISAGHFLRRASGSNH